MTVVPTGPDVLSNVSDGGGGAVKGASPASPDVPVTMTLYAPLAPAVTVNVPATVPPSNTHAGLEIRPLGSDDIEQPESLRAKLDPETDTGVPARPDEGSNEIPGVTLKGADLEVPLGFEATCTVEVPGTLPLLTLKEPVTAPPVIEQLIDARSTISGKAEIVQVVSVVGKPVPLTDTTVPTGP